MYDGKDSFTSGNQESAKQAKILALTETCQRGPGDTLRGQRKTPTQVTNTSLVSSNEKVFSPKFFESLR